MLRRALLLTAILSVVAAAIGGLWFHRSLWGFRSPRAVELEIAAGSTAREILVQLHTEQLLPSVLAGRIYLKTLASGQSLYYGHYRFPPASRPIDVFESILEGAVEMFAVTIVEGSEVSEIGQQFADLGLGTVEQWRGFGRRSEWIEDFAPGAPSLEGFLFPDTYRFAVGISAQRVALHLVERFRAVWSEEVGKAGEVWGSTLEIVTLASLVEAETSLDEERHLIAGVFANRLRRGMLLQCDPTVIYALKRRNEWKGRLLRISESTGRWTTPTTPIVTPGSPRGPSTPPVGPPWRRQSHPRPHHTSTSWPSRVAGTRSRKPCLNTTAQSPAS
jgi:UPF0755 protein